MNRHSRQDQTEHVHALTFNCSDPPDGIGPEVISSGIRVLEALARRAGDLSFNFQTFDWGSDYYKKTGS